MKIPKRSCINCHFLTRNGIEVTPQNRESVRKNRDFSWLNNRPEPSCYHKVWQAPLTGEFDFGKEIIGIDRKETCYFWKHIPNMSLSTGNDLKNKEAEKQEKMHDRRLVKISLSIAALSLLTSVVSLYFALR